jgi:hypothetical protein
MEYILERGNFPLYKKRPPAHMVENRRKIWEEI